MLKIKIKHQTAVSDETTSDVESSDSSLTDSDLVLRILRWFYDRLSLSEADQKSLFEKRGLTVATIDALGFRSNPDANKEILLEMPNHFPMTALVESGLWKVDPAKPGESPRPNPQFHGMSIAEKRDPKGRKVRDQNGEVIRECVWNHPILIPYFSEQGELIHLRPHKGMMAGKPPRFYVARPRGRGAGIKAINGNNKFAIITEGEFKAAALWQVLGEDAEIGALPGITMAKPLIGDVEEWLEYVGVRQVVVGYDNENKEDENLPGYQREKYRRYDTHVWALYLAHQLNRQGFEAKFCVLPDAWRDEKGKSDWDGSLAMFTKKMGVPDGSLVAWEKVRVEVRAKFLNVIHTAMRVGEIRQLSLFDAEIGRIIRSQLDKISYEPCLPIGRQPVDTPR